MADERDIKHFNKMANESKQRSANYMSLKGALEPKQETLEEAAERYKSLKLPDDLYDGFIEGAKWQAARMYSEEEVLVLLHKRDDYNFKTNAQSLLDWQTPKEWFEQFKKK
jgi:hypothetical protein